MSKSPSVQKAKSHEIKSLKNKGQKVQVSERPKVKKVKCLEVHLYQRPNVQKSKCLKDQMSTRPHVWRPPVQRPQVYLPIRKVNIDPDGNVTKIQLNDMENPQNEGSRSLLTKMKNLFRQK